MRTEKQLSTSLEEIILKKPTWSIYICLAYFLKGKTYIREGLIRRLLKRFVPKEDYSRSDTELLVEHLVKQTQNESV